MKTATIAIIASALVSGPFWVSAASSQNYGGQQPQQLQRSSFSEDQLESYAMAMQEVRKIRQEYGPQVNTAQSEDRVNAIRREATQKMVEAIEEEGLSVQQYNQITTAARADNDLKAKIRQHIQ